MIISRTPLRISFAGGGSDLQAYYRHGHGAVTSTAIPGTLLLKGVAMKATLKFAAILTPIIVAGTLLTVGGILPESLMFWGSGEEPLEGSLDFEIIDPSSERSLLDEFGLESEAAFDVSFSIAGGGSTTLAFPVRAPLRVGPIAFRVTGPRP